MWHHKTKLGTFWIIESPENHHYYLGLDEDDLGRYQRIEDAIRDIKQQETGHLKWDQARETSIPEDVQQWESGEPDNWDKF